MQNNIERDCGEKFSKNRVEGGEASYAIITAAKGLVDISSEKKLQKINKVVNYMTMNGRRAELIPPSKVLEGTAKQTIVNRCVKAKSKKLENAKYDQVRKVLTHIRQDIHYIARARQCTRVEFLI